MVYGKTIVEPDQDEYLKTLRKLAEQRQQNSQNAAQKQLEAAKTAAADTYSRETQYQQNEYAAALKRQATLRDNERAVSNAQAARVEKFLPQVMASQGLTGGVAQSLLMDAYAAAGKRSQAANNAYAEALAGLDEQRMQAGNESLARRDAATADAEQMYIAALKAADERRVEDDQTAYDAEYARRYQEKLMDEERKQETDNQYLQQFDEMMAAKLAAMEGENNNVSKESFDTWMESVKASEEYRNLPEYMRPLIDLRMQSYKAQETGIGSGESVFGDTGIVGSYAGGDHNGELKKGDRFTVKVGEDKYAVRSAGEVTGERLKAIKDKYGKLDLNTVFVYEGEPYIIYEGGRVYQIEAQADWNRNGAEAEEFKNLKAALGIMQQ